MDSDLLPPPLRLAVAYAPAAAKPAWSAFLALDRRLERAALGPREAILAQIRLAWWRERFDLPAAQWPHGEPLLAALQTWDAERPALTGLVDGWEGVVGGKPAPAQAAALAEARAQACAAVARLVGQGDCAGAAAELGRVWAQRDLAGRLGFELGPVPAPSIRLPRAFRPLVVLAEMARSGEIGGAAGLARIVRLGFLGR